MPDEFFDSAKPHRKRKAGKKSEKKIKKKSINSNKELNPKAFSFHSAVAAERRFRRKQDVLTKKYHLPEVDRTTLQPLPILVAVVGPPKVGKSTIIKNLVKLFTRSAVVSIKGPITVVIGKKRRVTFIECNNDINCMIDLAKVADLVLLLCDASFGFEMEVFEFLNICQVHGMPRILGILTHLDMIKNSKALKNTKKELKHRFWTEVYPGAKLFYLSGILHGEYLRNEIRNLGRFISVMKFRPLVWRTTHSYLLCDRLEDVTNEELVKKYPECDRTVSLYGYVRGVPLKKENSVHIAGLGDFSIQDMSDLPDPCPLPDQVKKRGLTDKEKLIYAPFSGVGGIVYDKDAVYIELGGSHSYKENEDFEESSVMNLVEAKETVDGSVIMHLDKKRMSVFSNNAVMEETGSGEISEDDNGDIMLGSLVKTKGHEANLHEEVQNELISTHFKEMVQEVDGLMRSKMVNKNEFAEQLPSDLDTSKSAETERNVCHKIKKFNWLLEHGSLSKSMEAANFSENDFQNSVSEEVDAELNEHDHSSSDCSSIDVKWKHGLAQKADSTNVDTFTANGNYNKIVYDVFNQRHFTEYERITESKSDDDAEDSIFMNVSCKQQRLKWIGNINSLETSLRPPIKSKYKGFVDVQNKERIADCFVTGQWNKSEDANELLKLDDAECESDGNSYEFGDFEDLETGEKYEAQNVSLQDRKRKLDDNVEKKEESLAEKKRRMKEKFDAEYDEDEKTIYYEDLKMTAEKQAQLNKNVFENMSDDVRVQIEGFRAGMYVRVEFENVPYKFVKNFDPTYPLIIGALNNVEGNIGYVNVRVKKHRWYNRILKTDDPVIVSLGWRRFQTKPVYSQLEDDMKFRYLKYTPQHIACNAHFWGPISPPGTGFLALQSVDSNPKVLKKQGFRIAATGVVQELDRSTQIMKKLKLIGCPLKIYKKTAFIKGMFHNAVEVAKFEGARIKTVSGIRGQIKKAISKPEGCFRATFEDNIKLSDIVFCRTWYKVDVTQYYQPVRSLLLPVKDKNSWKGVRTLFELKQEKGIRNTINKDSFYTPVEREECPFKHLVIPTKLEQVLPFRDKPKHPVKVGEANKSIERIAVILQPKEQEVSNMMRIIRTSYQHKQEKVKAEMKERIEKHKQLIVSEEARKKTNLKRKKRKNIQSRSKATNSKE